MKMYFQIKVYCKYKYMVDFEDLVWKKKCKNEYFKKCWLHAE